MGSLATSTSGDSDTDCALVRGTGTVDSRGPRGPHLLRVQIARSLAATGASHHNDSWRIKLCRAHRSTHTPPRTRATKRNDAPSRVWASWSAPQRPSCSSIRGVPGTRRRTRARVDRVAALHCAPSSFSHRRRAVVVVAFETPRLTLLRPLTCSSRGCSKDRRERRRVNLRRESVKKHTHGVSSAS